MAFKWIFTSSRFRNSSGYVFLQEVDLFTRHFDLKAKMRKAALVNRFLLNERSF